MDEVQRAHENGVRSAMTKLLFLMINQITFYKYPKFMLSFLGIRAFKRIFDRNARGDFCAFLWVKLNEFM